MLLPLSPLSHSPCDRIDTCTASSHLEKCISGQEENSGAMSSAQLEWTLFFDIMPQETLDNVLRFFSDLPHAVHWSKHIPLSYITPLYRVRGGLGVFINTRFRTLCISCTMDCPHERIFYKWKVPNESILCTYYAEDALDFVLGGGGQSLHTLIIANSKYDVIIEEFHRACPNVRSLSVVENIGKWSSMFAPQLEKLEVARWRPFGFIPKHCSSLLELIFHYKGTFGLPYLDISAFDWGNMSGKLESLVLTMIIISEDGLKNIQKQCKNLKYIDIRSSSEFALHIAEFIASYGKQLDLVCIYDMPEIALKHVFDKCANARFHLETTWYIHLPSMLRILEPRLEKVKFEHKEEVIDVREWISAWNLCSNLKVLDVTYPTVEMLRSIMATPKYLLKEIRINSIHYGEPEDSEEDPDVETVWNIISKGTKHLEFLEFIDVGIHSIALNKLIDKNKSNMRSINIFCFNLGISNSDVDEITGKLIDCPLLQDISMSEYPGESLLDMLRKRGINFTKEG